MAKALIVPVSFKRTERDLELYEKISNEDDKSYIMKQALRFYYDNKDKQIIERIDNVVTKEIERSIETKVEKSNNPAISNAINSIIGFGDD